MKIFVTGATGYVGSAVAAALRRAGHDVSGLVRTEEKGKRLWAEEVRPVIGELRKPESFTAAVREADAVVHCAAEMSIAFAELDRKSVEALLAAMKDGGRPRTFIYTSGCWVYGDTGGRAVDETSTLTPLDLVAWRPAVEQTALSASSELLSVAVVRLGCVYGGRHRPPFRHGGLTNNWFESAEKEGAARIVGEGNNRWAMIHVEDAADLYLRIAEAARGPAREIYNAVDRSPHTVREMAAAAATAAGRAGQVRVWPVPEASRQLGPFAGAMLVDQRIDAGKAASALGWRPRFESFAANAEHCFQSWKNRT